MKKTLYLAAVFCGLFFSTPSSAADATAGKGAYSSKGCIGCHGPDGDSQIAAYPKLKGQSVEFIAEQLQAFRSGERKNPIMNGMAGALSDEDIANLAAYLSALK